MIGENEGQIRLRRNLRITTSFKPERASLSDYVRMEWRIRSWSSKDIRIIGYSCPMYFRDELKGVYVAETGRWMTDTGMISNEHIVTVLRESEYRTYVWEQVHPRYYGIDAVGRWSYKLRIYYQILGERGMFSEEADNAYLEIVTESAKETEVSLRNALRNWRGVSEILHIVRRETDALRTVDIPSMAQPEPQAITRTPFGFVDYVLSGKRKNTLVEIRVLRKLRVPDIRHMVSKTEWYDQVYQSEGATSGIIICTQASKRAILDAIERGITVVQLIVTEEGEEVVVIVNEKAVEILGQPFLRHNFA